MSGTEGAPNSRPPPAGPPQRNGCLTALMVIIGIILLLPGVCLVSLDGRGPLGLIGLVLSVAAAVLLLAAAIRKWGLGPPPS
ncbi:hypothetical protein I3J27_01505 [Bradyrhizobium xenonodulans]|uniref:Uncharacterized protein n=1 Tax=Bradyrhizobium xenonodulans TaxID=2736875 RepID=A0ABY7MMG2_9BRAD|nr:hypothetical protein [Bradyrhizobium xenonodulans]WBL79126.1 hypothetical protein I3J27_01505 [Bradyrhizobium xenonodulans]